jgi:hypothetical protein
MIKWQSIKKDGFPKLKKPCDHGGMTSERLLLWITDHIGFGSYRVYDHDVLMSSRIKGKAYAFWSIEDHGGECDVTHWARITPPKGVR